MLLKVLRKKQYIGKLKIYHKKLEEFIKEHYGLDTDYLENTSWGYNTTTFYLKTKQGDYVARLGGYSTEKEENVRKDIMLTNLLRSHVPTAEYIRTKDGSYFKIFNEDKIVRVTKYIQGTPPFNMTLDVLKEAVSYLKNIHQHPVDNLDLPLKPGKHPKLLHGDLTPSNILISFDKIVGIVDFEMAVLGPVEWDLARCAVFGWYRMSDVAIEKALQIVAETYNDPTLDTDLLIEFAVKNAQEHLKNVKSHKEFYDNAKDWENDLKDAKTKLETITQAFKN